MNKFVDGSRVATLTALRVGVGVVMTVHGWLKLTDIAAWQGSVAALGIPAPEVAAWASVIAELGGGLLLLFGLLTPLAAVAIAVNMLVAIVTVHAGNGLLASNNGFELPLTLALVAAYFAARGGGPLSVDAVVMERRRKAKASAPPVPEGDRARWAEA